MSDKTDWTQLGDHQHGLAVEGKDDLTVITAFLNAGEGLHWHDWRTQVVIQAAGGDDKVLQQLNTHPRVWGIIDRDWRTDADIAQLERDHPRLLVLPRITIENYCIDPNELMGYLPPHAQPLENEIRTAIESHVDTWLQNGALWRTLSEHGARAFCRGHEEGYPMALLYHPVTDEQAIARQFERWHRQLDLHTIMTKYRATIAAYRANPSATFQNHIHGKNFFAQVVVPALNFHFGQRSHAMWFYGLMNTMPACPPDIIPLLQRLVT